MNLTRSVVLIFLVLSFFTFPSYSQFLNRPRIIIGAPDEKIPPYIFTGDPGEVVLDASVISEKAKVQESLKDESQEALENADTEEAASKKEEDETTIESDAFVYTSEKYKNYERAEVAQKILNAKLKKGSLTPDKSEVGLGLAKGWKHDLSTFGQTLRQHEDALRDGSSKGIKFYQNQFSNPIPSRVEYLSPNMEKIKQHMALDSLGNLVSDAEFVRGDPNLAYDDIIDGLILAKVENSTQEMDEHTRRKALSQLIHTPNVSGKTGIEEIYARDFKMTSEGFDRSMKGALGDLDKVLSGLSSGKGMKGIQNDLEKAVDRLKQAEFQAKAQRDGVEGLIARAVNEGLSDDDRLKAMQQLLEALKEDPSIVIEDGAMQKMYAYVQAEARAYDQKVRQMRKENCRECLESQDMEKNFKFVSQLQDYAKDIGNVLEKHMQSPQVPKDSIQARDEVLQVKRKVEVYSANLKHERQFTKDARAIERLTCEINAAQENLETCNEGLQASGSVLNEKERTRGPLDRGNTYKSLIADQKNGTIAQENMGLFKCRS